MGLKVLGVDPGSRVTGYGLLEIEGDHVKHIAHGVLQLNDKLTFMERIRDLGIGFRSILLELEPEHVVVENLFLGKNADSAFKLGHARGVLMYEALLQHRNVFEYATRSVKKGVTGKGSSQKEDVQGALRILLNLNCIQKLDASDALAMAYHHALELRKKAMISRWEFCRGHE